MFCYIIIYDNSNITANRQIPIPWQILVRCFHLQYFLWSPVTCQKRCGPTLQQRYWCSQVESPALQAEVSTLAGTQVLRLHIPLLPHTLQLAATTPDPPDPRPPAFHTKHMCHDLPWIKVQNRSFKVLWPQPLPHPWIPLSFSFLM